jgi:glycosyltransferase involved in cell wall biosynthesis
VTTPTVENILRPPGSEPPKHYGWHIITCEYPPQAGGVSDYTYQVAAGLARHGDEVHVWCPAHGGSAPQAEGVVVHPNLGALAPADLREAGRRLDAFPGPRRILVQWVPHGYGYRSMNLPFCWWLRNRAIRSGDQVDIMLHEPYLPFSKSSVRQNAVALVHRLMTLVLLRATRRVWMSIPQWEGIWRPFALGRPISFKWLPIPSNIPVTNDPSRVEAVRRRYAADGGSLIGHFGTFGRPITALLEPILLALADDPARQTVLLMGIRSEEFRESVIHQNPRLAGLVKATGALEPEDLSCHISACDLLMQPYPDGVSSRRTSAMIGLCHGKATVTTTGNLSEPFWAKTGALALAPAAEVDAFVQALQRLRGDAGERARMAQAARALYRERFDISHVIQALRRAAAEDLQCAS